MKPGVGGLNNHGQASLACRFGQRPRFDNKGGEYLKVVPEGVRSCLYTGIGNNIDFLIARATEVIQSKQRFMKSYDLKKYEEVKEALSWYTEHCLESSLEEDLQEFERLYQKIKEEESI